MNQPNRSALDHDRFAFVVVPQWPSMALGALGTVFRLANREMGQTVYRWHIVSVAGGMVAANDGTRIETERCEAAGTPFSAVFVLASYRPLDHIAGLRPWLSRQRRAGAMLAGIESGTRILAQAGLLGSHAVALHHEDEESFREAWPDQPIHRGPFNLETGIATAAGVTATLDLALALVERRHGALLANQVARVLLHARRDTLGRSSRSGTTDEARPATLERCRDLMLEHLQDPLTLAELCRRLGIEERTLRRRFRTALGVAPMRYYQALRLTEARYMLVGTDLPVTEVALACGFSNSAAFARAFKAHFGFPPSTRRDPYAGLLPSPFWPQEFAATSSTP